MLIKRFFCNRFDLFHVFLHKKPTLLLLVVSFHANGEYESIQGMVHKSCTAAGTKLADTYSSNAGG